jgi:hypothetical protein
MALVDGSDLPLAVCAASAPPHEVTLVGATLEASFLDERPERLIGDRAYDSDPLDEALDEEGIEMIAPHRNNRRKPKNPGRSQAQALREALEDRAALRLARELPSLSGPLRAVRRELPRLREAGVHRHPAYWRHQA